MKAEVINKIRDHLNKEMYAINVEIRRNKYKMKALAEEQAILKRSLPAYRELIKSLDNKKGIR